MLDASASWMPDYLARPTAWAAHAPFAFWLVGALAPRVFVELGTYWGYSYFAVCQAVQRRGIEARCHAVDTWSGDDHTGFYGPDVHSAVAAYNDERFGSFSTLVQSTFDDALGEFPDGSVDLLHIDGRHFYADVSHDFEMWRPKLSERAVVLFHDTQERDRDFGVHQLWQELRESYPTFEFVHGHGLGVLGFGSALPESVLPLLALAETDPETQVVRDFYEHLGAAISDRMARIDLEARLAEAQLRRTQDDGDAARMRDPVDGANQALRAAERPLRATEAERLVLSGDLEATARASAPVDAPTIQGQGIRHHAARWSRLVARWVSAVVRRSPLRRPGPLRPSPLFDPAWYVVRYADVRPALGGAWRHYWRHGRHERRDPNAFLDSEWYLAENPDVLVAQVDPLDHYLRHGGFEGRDPGPRFASGWYLQRYPDVAALGINPLLHFLTQGRAEGRSPGPDPEIPTDLVAPLPAIDDPSHRSLTARAWVYYQRNGLRPLILRIRDEARRRMPLRDRSGRLLQGPWRELRPQHIFATIDSPQPDELISAHGVAIEGWACALDGVDSIEVYLDLVAVRRITTGDDRPDVGRTHRKIPDAATSGFSAIVDIDELEPGRHFVTLAVHDRSGNTRVVQVPITVATGDAMYHRYFVRMLPTDAELGLARRAAMARGPLPSFHIALRAAGDADLNTSLRSIASQGYPDWRCSILVDDDRREETAATLVAIADRADTRFGITSDPAVMWATAGDQGRFHCFLDAGETLSPGALECFAYEALVDAATPLIYGDHDSVMRSGRHADPCFLPDWSPDHELSRDYVGGVFMARGGPSLVDALRERISFDAPAWRYDLLLRLTDTPADVVHIPRVLWSAPAETVAMTTQLADAQVRAVSDALSRRTPGATAERDAHMGIRHIEWPISGDPHVSIVIPTTGRPDLVRPCLESIAANTAYTNYELVFLDNSRGRNPDGIDFIRERGHRVIERDEPFNWARLNNAGASATSGALLLFLNDDVEAQRAPWLTEMVRLATRPDIGTVGSLLTYPDGRIQHAGVVLVGRGGGAMHLLHRLDPGRGTYLDLDQVTRETTANTGACMMVSRDHFERVGGFDEDLEVVGNDIDLCLRLSALGLRSVWTPYSALIHHESVSRKSVSTISDETRMWRRWSDKLRAGDPYLNPNLGQDRSDCSIDWSRLADRPEPAVDATAGVNLVGYIRAEMGVGEATRGQAQAMTDVGIPFVTLDYEAGNPARMTDTTFVHTVVSEPRYDVNLVYVNADVLGKAMASLPRTIRQGRYTIGQWAWEMPDFPDHLAPSFDLVDEVWCPSEFVRESIARKSPVPVIRMPHAIRVPAGPLAGRGHLGLPVGPYQFLMMYDVNSVTERKNPRGAFEAFAAAFPPDDPSVNLVIKINNADARESRQIREMVDARPNVTIIDRILDRDEVDSLISCSDAFVSLHRSEGFGLTLAEAMGLGRPVIATHWSGNVDFMREENAACVRYVLTRLDRDHGPYAAGQEWAEPDLDHAGWWMRRLRDDPSLGRELGKRGQATIRQEFGPVPVGKLTARRLQEIREPPGVGHRPKHGQTGRSAGWCGLNRTYWWAFRSRRQ